MKMPAYKYNYVGYEVPLYQWMLMQQWPQQKDILRTVYILRKSPPSETLNLIVEEEITLVQAESTDQGRSQIITV
jgi:hypothetical protein